MNHHRIYAFLPECNYVMYGLSFCISKQQYIPIKQANNTFIYPIPVTHHLQFYMYMYLLILCHPLRATYADITKEKDNAPEQ